MFFGLQEEARESKRAASGVPDFPISNKEWLMWMAENSEEFNLCFKNASLARRAINVRLDCSIDFPAAARLQADRPGDDIVWQDKLWSRDPGFFCLKFAQERQARRHSQSAKSEPMKNNNGGTWGFLGDLGFLAENLGLPQTQFLSES